MPYWCLIVALLLLIGAYWSLLVPIGAYWILLLLIGAYWTLNSVISLKSLICLVFDMRDDSEEVRGGHFKGGGCWVTFCTFRLHAVKRDLSI